MVQATLHRVFDAILADPQASMREIEQSAGVALGTVQAAIKELARRELLIRDVRSPRSITLRCARHQGHAYRVVWFDPS